MKKEGWAVMIIDQGAKVTAKLIGERYCRSPLVKGVLDIPCKVSASMLGTCVNVLFLGSYKQLTQGMYFELKVQVSLVFLLVPILASQTLELGKK